MTDKQIDFVKKLDKTVFFDGDTIQFNFIEFDKPIKGFCFNKSVYIPIEELEYILQQLFDKEQECEELKKIIEEAKNSKLDLKSFLVGEAVQNEYEQQIDQLKAENKDYKEGLDKLYNLNKKIIDEKFKIDCQNTRFKQTLTEIKEIAETCSFTDCSELLLSRIEHILEKISEVEDENTSL